jgi:hypothetical protein
VTTKGALEAKIGATGKITVELAQLADDESRPVYKYKITDMELGVRYEAADLQLGATHRPDNTKAAEALLDFLSAASDSYEAEMEGRSSENAALFPRDIAVYAYVSRNEIAMAQMDLGSGLEAAR